MTSTPPPDDKVLSPLSDPRLTSLELRARDEQNRDVVIGRARYNRAEAAGMVGMDGAMAGLSLGPIPVADKRELRFLALGAAGQQVLGLAVTRDVEVRYGADLEYVFDVRRPLFFFGSGRKLVAPIPFSMDDAPLSPGRRIAEGLRDDNLLRAVDPNSGTPLLAGYNLSLDGTNPAVASAATSDGLSVLVVTLPSTLHVVETLRLKPALSVKLQGDLPPQTIAVSPRDDSAVILHYDVSAPPLGKVGRLTFVRDLPGLRGRVSKDGSPMVVDIESKPDGMIGPPLSAVYGPDGLVDVVFGRSPLLGGEPNCAQLSGMGKSVLRRYDPKTGEVRYQAAIDYTTAVAYTAAGEQVLVQPCSKAAAGKRPGQVAFQVWQGDGFVKKRVLPAPGSADVAVVGGRATLVAVGRDDVMDTGAGRAQGVVRVLEPGLSDWSLQSPFSLDDWQIPFRLTIGGDGMPLPSSLDIVLAPRDVLVYRVVATPDRTRALVTVRVTHSEESLYLSDLGTNICFVGFEGYTYYVMLINLQTGAREQSWLTAVRMQSCDSSLYNPVTKQVIGTCFSECDMPDPMKTKGRLRNYQEGIIPTATSALFSGQ